MVGIESRCEFRGERGGALFVFCHGICSLLSLLRLSDFTVSRRALL